MRCLYKRPLRTKALDRTLRSFCRASSNQNALSATSSSLNIQQVPHLPSWDTESLHQYAYLPAVPAFLPKSKAHLLPACSKWFVHDDQPDLNLLGSRRNDGGDVYVPVQSQLRTLFWLAHEETLVPLEITHNINREARRDSIFEDDSHDETFTDAERTTPSYDKDFHRTEAPLKLLLAYLSDPASPSWKEKSVYLAQCDLSSLPSDLQDDVPIPSILKPSPSSGLQTDVYSTSLWLGRAPTHTPLHRDPNPNLFMQLAGKKVVRLVPPHIGEAIYEEIRAYVHDLDDTAGPRRRSSAIRGDEMMFGVENRMLHDAVWSLTPSAPFVSSLAPRQESMSSLVQAYCQEAHLGLGDALFIPKGWWHSVKSEGPGVSASVNWWFRFRANAEMKRGGRVGFERSLGD